MDSDITPSNKILQLQYCDIHERHWIWMVINLEYFIVNAIQIPKQCPQNQTIYMLIPNWLCSAAACCTSLWWAAPPWPGSVRPSWGSRCCRPRWTPSCWFLAYKIHKSCCLRRDCAEQQDLLFYWLYFDDLLYVWEYIIAYPPENISPRFVANIYCWFITNNKCGYIAYISTNIVL